MVQVMKELDTSNSKIHSENIRQEFQELIDHLRRDIGKVKDPQAKALFETSAEVLTGLVTAFKHYEDGIEEAWRQ